MTAHDESRIRPLDRRRPEPLWHQLADALRGLIDAKEWAPGTQIPPEDQLCELFGVSRITVRHAIRTLEEQGLLRREHGRGTFVRQPLLVAGARGLTSFSDEMVTQGARPGSLILECEVVQADPAVAGALGVAEGTPVTRLRRLRLSDDEPMGVQTSYVPLGRAGDLAEHVESTPSLYQLLRERYGIRPVEATELYRVGVADAREAELLQVAAGSPVFIVERITLDDAGPFELAVSTMRGDRYEIRSTLRAF
jgi:GntR family transcriptional regulator